MSLLARLEFLTGDRAGQTTDLLEEYTTFGRHPMCTVAFDAEQDLEVSGRHAAVHRDGDLFILRDLGSTNGTFVNGRRLRDDHVVASLDEVQFGMRGPRLRFHLAADPPAPLPPTAAPSPLHYSPIPPRRTKEEVSPDDDAATPGNPDGPPAQLVPQTAGSQRLLRHIGVTVVVVVAAVAVFLGLRERTVNTERLALLAHVDTLLDAMDTMHGRLESMQSSLDSGHAEMERLRSAIREGGTSAEFQQLRRVAQATIERQEHLLDAAAHLDLERIAAARQPAVALVVIEAADGRAYTGTGFGVASDPQGGMVLTNKHVVLDAGRSPQRVAVIFHGSARVLAATVAGIHPSEDAALLRVEVRGGIPVVETNGSVPAVPGVPVAVIGYPLGLDLPKGSEWRRAGVATTIMAGTITRTTPGYLQLDGYGTEGSSGSPIFDAEGRAIGFLYGGESGAAGRILHALPIDIGLELLVEPLRSAQ